MAHLPAISKNTLFVAVPGLRAERYDFKKMQHFLDESLQLIPGNWVYFHYDKNPMTSNEGCQALADQLRSFIESEWGSRREQALRIVIVAHSIGTAVARRAFLDAAGFGADKQQARQWAQHVDRLVLIAGIGRGIDLRRARHPHRRLMEGAAFLARALGFGGTVRDIFRGAPFICQLRIDWILFNQSKNQRPGIVHLLGLQDEFSTRDDVIDLDQFENVKTFDVNANHTTILNPRSC
jgi:pimeloyl-ACP methyl ester carboxylesterase